MTGFGLVVAQHTKTILAVDWQVMMKFRAPEKREAPTTTFENKRKHLNSHAPQGVQSPGNKRRCFRVAAASKHSAATSATSLESLETELSRGTLLKIAAKAKEVVQLRFRSLGNFECATRRIDHCPKLAIEQLLIGERLGKGGFGVVTEIKGISFDRTDISGNDEFAKLQNGECSRYAIKMLDDSHCGDRKAFFSGSRDMAVEAYILAAMNHPNILSLRGISKEPLGSKNFFLMFDRLYGTLKDRNQEWKLKQHDLTRSVKKLVKPKATTEKLRDILETKLRVLCDLSSAVAHLHQRNVLDRDVKPDNVGFDISGNVKLFDFGLSTEVDPVWPKPYNLTGMVGSLAYMAPEVHLRKPYDESSDIYSLGLLFWKTLTLQPLFPQMTPNLLKEWVVIRGIRPLMDSSLSDTLRTLINSMWDADPKQRPRAVQVTLALRHEIAAVEAKSGFSTYSTSFLRSRRRAL